MLYGEYRALESREGWQSYLLCCSREPCILYGSNTVMVVGAWRYDWEAWKPLPWMQWWWWFPGKYIQTLLNKETQKGGDFKRFRRGGWWLQATEDSGGASRRQRAEVIPLQPWTTAATWVHCHYSEPLRTTTIMVPHLRQPLYHCTVTNKMVLHSSIQ